MLHLVIEIVELLYSSVKSLYNYMGRLFMVVHLI